MSLFLFYLETARLEIDCSINQTTRQSQPPQRFTSQLRESATATEQLLHSFHSQCTMGRRPWVQQ